jgi:hypothetical protein
MDPALQKTIALGVLPPALLTGIVLLVSWWWKRLPAAQADRGALVPPTFANTKGERLWLAPLVFAICYVGVHHFLLGGVRLVPTAAADWMPWVAALAGTLGMLARVARMPTIVRWIWRALVAGVIAYALARTKLARGWESSEAALTMGGFVLHTLLAWWLLERVADRTRGVSGPIVLMLYATGASQLLALAYYSLRLAQMPTVMAAVMGAAMVVAMLRPRFTLASGGVHVVLLVSNAAFFSAVLFPGNAILPRVFPWILLASPLLAAAVDLIPEGGPRLTWLSGWKRTLLRVALAFIPVAIAISLVLLLRPADEY